CLSMTHIAFSSVRVMRTLGMLGEVIGMAAAVCRRHDCLPKAVYSEYLDELKALMTAGIDMTPPCSWGVGYQDAYHFMRPVGMFGNANENCWIRYDVNGKPTADIPQGLQEVIDRLGVQRKPYSKE
ncbi:MAG: FAD-dependent oxidoreductase, partial [Victivallales bacterium]|nr:FAD-dependent oxidoreductase [Victivallales bacterium]